MDPDYKNHEKPKSYENLNEEPAVFVGRQFREQREAGGIQIEAAAQALFVDKKHLQALENDNLEQIGSPVFVRGYAKNYARYLGLDVDQIVAMLEPHIDRMVTKSDREVSFLDVDNGTRAELDYRKTYFKLADRKKTAVLSYGVAFLVFIIVLVFVSYQYFYEDQSEGYRSMALTIQPSEPLESPTDNLPEPQVDENSQIENVSDESGQSKITDQGLLEDAAQDVSGAEQALVTNERRLVFSFRGNSWLNIVDVAKKSIASRVFLSGETAEFIVRVPADVVLGNASQVSLRLNDAPFDYTKFVRGDVARFTVK